MSKSKTTMVDQPFLRLALPTPLRRLFDYLPPQPIDYNKLKPGVRVKVPFQSRTLMGILTEVVNQTSVPYGKLKRAIEIVDQEPILTEDVYKLCAWAAEYYHYAFGEVLSSALPTLLRKGHSVSTKPFHFAESLKSLNTLPPLNTSQLNAVDAIMHAQASFKVFLLDGVTGSGKTEVYLRVMENVLKNGRQVLVLVPEISLTPQTVARFRERVDAPMVVLHSGLSDQERLQAWSVARAGTAKVIIGTRSAIFTPLVHLGLVIVDEEHDASFKQQDRFRYHARDLAIMRANMNQVPVVLGSATPSLESLLNVKRDRYQHLILPERAGNASMPKYHVVDVRQVAMQEGLSPALMSLIREHLDNEQQVMLFLNRRGYAPVLYCAQCAWIAGCQRCDTRLVYHRKPLGLRCHHCDARQDIPTNCGQCGQATLEPVGLGTQRLEQVLKSLFTDVPIIRIDRDSTRRKGAMQAMLDQMHVEGKAILLGTQMLAKGHHFSRVTLVGIIDADSGLFSADFRAAEQMGQLLIQVAGRAGREDKPGTVVIQTRHPDHPLLQSLLWQGYPAFAQALLAERELAVLPPFSYFAVFRAEAHAEQNASQFLDVIKQLSVTLTDAVTVLGPVPALIAKRKGLHCQQLLVRANRRSALQHFLTGILQQIDKIAGTHPVKWMLDVDPVEVA